VVVDGVLVPDPRRRAPGRGAHLHPEPDCLAAAERRSAFRRAFRSSGPFDASELQEFVAGQFVAGKQISTQFEPKAGRDDDESSMSSSR
jgi:predicted RNA-binding protein YlxR (DUF448 family)